MSDQDFRERVLSALERLEQKTDRIEQKFEQQYERLEQKFDQKFESLETRMGLLEQGVGWIRGKMEGKLEAGATLWSRVAVGTAIVSAIIALFALFKGV